MQTSYKPTIIVYSQPNCPACDTTKNLVKLLGFSLEERIVGKGGTKEQLLADCPNVRSVPQVLVDGIYLGNGQAFERKYMKCVLH